MRPAGRESSTVPRSNAVRRQADAHGAGSAGRGGNHPVGRVYAGRGWRPKLILQRDAEKRMPRPMQDSAGTNNASREKRDEKWP